jgi:ABC-2 type transporter
MLMALGKIIYFNEARLAVSYFSNLGFTCPKFSNPADYFMHMMSIEDTKANISKEGTIVAKSKEMIMEEQKVKIMEFHI